MHLQPYCAVISSSSDGGGDAAAVQLNTIVLLQSVNDELRGRGAFGGDSCRLQALGGGVHAPPAPGGREVAGMRPCHCHAASRGRSGAQGRVAAGGDAGSTPGAGSRARGRRMAAARLGASNIAQ